MEVVIVKVASELRDRCGWASKLSESLNIFRFVLFLNLHSLGCCKLFIRILTKLVLIVLLNLGYVFSVAHWSLWATFSTIFTNAAATGGFLKNNGIHI